MTERRKVRVLMLLWLLQCSSCDLTVLPAFSCPAVCICLSGSQVLCDGAGLDSLPHTIPTSVEELSLCRNQLYLLTSDMFASWPKLRTISLDGNQIQQLQPFIFRGLSNLNKISIQRNPLTELTAFSFSKLENVSQINLSNNQIHTINANAFSGSCNIGMLLLQNNPLKILKARAFSGLNTVQFLYLPSWIKALSDAGHEPSLKDGSKNIGQAASRGDVVLRPLHSLLSTFCKQLSGERPALRDALTRLLPLLLSFRTSVGQADLQETPIEFLKMPSNLNH
ncbi:Leucine rich repeat 5 [Trinorchestia longiramus]|nr:Leucine rich repeat 5 [Trinorchestia longiramus]